MLYTHGHMHCIVSLVGGIFKKKMSNSLKQSRKVLARGLGVEEIGRAW